MEARRECLVIADDFKGHSKQLFCVPSHYVDAVSSVLIPQGVIEERVKKMARNILEDVLQERAARLATANICLTDIEEKDTIQDLMVEEKESFAGLMALVDNEKDVGMSGPVNIIDIFNEAMETGDEEARSDLSSYGIELSELLEEQPSKVEELYDPGIGQSATPSPGFSHISIRPFARVQPAVRQKVHFLCILRAQDQAVKILQNMPFPSVKGGYKFFLDLLDQVNKFNSTRSLTSIQVALDFIKIETRASGSVGIQGIQDVRKLYGANIVIVEDIVDTGRTMVKVLSSLEKFQPKQVLIACLLRKRSKVQCYLPDYVGFEVPNKLLVGYALDFNEYFRDLMHICVLSEEGQQRFSARK